MLLDFFITSVLAIHIEVGQISVTLFSGHPPCLGISNYLRKIVLNSPLHGSLFESEYRNFMEVLAESMVPRLRFHQKGTPLKCNKLALSIYLACDIHA